MINRLNFERELRNKSFFNIAGVDEVGRGALAGPVVAAAVILPEDFFDEEIIDSKKISKKKREDLSAEIKTMAIDFAIAEISPQKIDEINILQASKLAMKKALEKLKSVDAAIIDALEVDVPIQQINVYKAEELSISVAAASIIAKVYRDQIMEEYAKEFGQYHFETNVGYGTKQHLEAVKKFGVTSIHRKTFAPIRNQK